DDGFEPVTLNDPAANIALARSGIAGKQWRAVENNRQARAFRLHLRDHVHDEEQRAVVDARQAGAEAAFEGLFVMFPLYEVGLRLPLDAEGRVGEQVVEPVPRQTVLGEAVAELDVLRVLALD